MEGKRREKGKREGHFRVAMDLIMKGKLSAKAFHMKISFVCICMKTNFHDKTLHLASL